VNSENRSKTGVARENLAKARVTGEISFNAKRMKINDPAQKRMIIVKETNEVNLRSVVKPSPILLVNLLAG
jgi:hypothetical protein